MFCYLIICEKIVNNGFFFKQIFSKIKTLLSLGTGNPGVLTSNEDDIDQPDDAKHSDTSRQQAASSNVSKLPQTPEEITENVAKTVKSDANDDDGIDYSVSLSNSVENIRKSSGVRREEEEEEEEEKTLSDDTYTKLLVKCNQMAGKILFFLLI